MGLLDTLRRSLGGKGRSEAAEPALSLRGYGLDVAPTPPFAATHLDDGSVVVTAPPGGAPRPELLLVPGREPLSIVTYLSDADAGVYALGSSEPGTSAVLLPPGQRDPRAAGVAVQVVPTRPDGWRLRTAVYDFPLPEGFTLIVEAGHDAFEVTAEPQVSVLMLGPFRGRAQVPHPDHLAPRGTTFADQGKLSHVPEPIPWFAFGYEDGDEAFVQRFYELVADPLTHTVYLMRVEAPEDVAKAVCEVTDAMARGFVPVPR